MVMIFSVFIEQVLLLGAANIDMSGDFVKHDLNDEYVIQRIMSTQKG